MTVDYADPGARFDWVGVRRRARPNSLDRHPDLTLRIEPGRALTAYCGWYVTDVLDVKQSHGEEFAVVRGGTHHLRTPATKGHDQPCTVLPVDSLAAPLAAPGRETRTWSRSTGQLCTPKDVLARERPGAGAAGGRPRGVRAGRAPTRGTSPTTTS